MLRELWVHLLPTLFEPNDLRGGISVVIDVLRASTTIVHALSAGAKAVIPCCEVDEARKLAANLPPEEGILGGERESRLIEGFDLDNSPMKYTADIVQGKTVIFTTTNGTRALQRCREAERILIGAFVNLSAVVSLLAAEEKPVHLVCAGTRGEVTGEDCLFAGAVVDKLQNIAGDAIVINDEARLTVEYYKANSSSDAALLEAIRNSRGGRNLRELGFDADMRRAAQLDLFDLVPVYSPVSGRIESTTTRHKG